jgi:carbonic anhydrase/acetyltransferase-like protein (isoleucine patch superfamily)
MKYIRDPNTGIIRATDNFSTCDGILVRQGDFGGRIDSTRNLAQSGKCWVFPGAEIRGDAYVSGNAVVGDIPEESVTPKPALVTDNARIYGNAIVRGSTVQDNARVLGNAKVLNESKIKDDACVSGDCTITHLENEYGVVIKTAFVGGKSRVQGEASIRGGTIGTCENGFVGVYEEGEPHVAGKAVVEGAVMDKGDVSGCTYIDPTSWVECDGRLSGCAKLYDNAVLSCRAIVYGNRVVRKADLIAEYGIEKVTDARLVTNCPEKNGGGCNCP